MILGTGKYAFKMIDGWGQGPEGRAPGGRACGVAVDSRDRVHVLVRTSTPVLVYDTSGRFLNGWGEGLFAEVHGIWISPDDMIYICDAGGHTMRKFTNDGKLLRTWGTPNQPAEPGKPFNGTQDVILTDSGEMFVADGYNNCMHKFSADGEWLFSWGEPGNGPSQFSLPHAVDIDHEGRLLVADRENNRLQFFDMGGRYLTEWPVPKPNDVYVAKDGMIWIAEEEKRKVSVYNDAGEQLARFGERGQGPGQFKSFIHTLWPDSHGDLYIVGMMRDNDMYKLERA